MCSIERDITLRRETAESERAAELLRVAELASALSRRAMSNAGARPDIER